MNNERNRQICNYEGSAYRTEFWGQGRAYEDKAERAALQHMLPPTGKRLIDIGGGYGRLIPLYKRYDEVIVFDYALSQLRQAYDIWGPSGPQGHPRYTYVAGDFYELPFAPAAFDTVVMVRTLHHATDAPAVLRGVSRILVSEGSFVLEFANKRNLKAILRFLVGRQDWSPFNRQPVEFVSLNFDFHPSWIEDCLEDVGLHIRERRAVSMFRLGLLKQLLPTDLLVTLDRCFQPTGAILALSPSVFIRSQSESGMGSNNSPAFFRCTKCGSTQLEDTGVRLSCHNCATWVPIQDGIYNFKAPHPQTGKPAPPQP